MKFQNPVCQSCNVIRNKTSYEILKTDPTNVSQGISTFSKLNKNVLGPSVEFRTPVVANVWCFDDKT